MYTSSQSKCKCTRKCTNEELMKQRWNVLVTFISMGRKRTSGVSHNKNSKTYKSSNRSVPSDSQTQSIKNFFTVSRPEQEHEESEVSHFTLL